MNYKLLITATVVAFAVASVFLAITLDRQFAAANYWSIAFTDPQSASYDFIITNNTDSDAFSYTVTNANGKVTPYPALAVPPHTILTVTPTLPSLNKKSATITVTHDDEKHILQK